MYRKIMVPLDGSPTAERGLQEALGLAAEQKAELLLVHVIEAMPMLADPSGMVAWADLQQMQRDDGARLLAAARTQADARGVRASTVLREAPTGGVAGVLVEALGTTGCDLVVMGTHGRRGIRRLAMGSDAEALVRQVPVPVLLVRAAEPG